MKSIHTDILKAWHCIEFFQPYEPPSNKNTIQIYLNEVVNHGNDLLPWLNQSAARKARIPHGFVANYSLHFAIFNKNELTRMAKEHLPEYNKASQIDIHTIDEHLRDEGKTCFAKLTLNEYGTPNFSDFSISTLPWALGKLKNNQLNQLTLKNYNDDLGKLKEAIHRIQSGLKTHPSSQEHQTLSASDIISTCKQLCLWAGFKPEALTNDPDKFILCQLDCKPFKTKKKQLNKNPMNKYML